MYTWIDCCCVFSRQMKEAGSMTEQTERTLTYSCLCPADGTEKEVRLLYTANSTGIFWRNKTLNTWCDRESDCTESMGAPPRCPIFLAALRFLPREDAK